LVEQRIRNAWVRGSNPLCGTTFKNKNNSSARSAVPTARCLNGQRFEILSRYRGLEYIHLRYARWDFSRVDLIDARTGQILCPIRPLDKAANADALRRRLDPTTPSEPSAMPATGIAPLLKQMTADYAATGLPPAYLPTLEKDDAV
jgi:putative transposase